MDDRSGELNYFHYFTEIEEYFWRKRGAHILVSPLDWAIVESWQKAGIPLEAVLRGIDRAFESYRRSRRGQSGRPLKSLVYCVDAVLDEAEQMREAAAGEGPEAAAARPAPFSLDELRAYCRNNLERLQKAAENVTGTALAEAIQQVASRLEQLIAEELAGPALPDLEALERTLTVLEEKLAAAATAATAPAVLEQLRAELDRSLAPYRRRMTAPQLALLERQYLQKRLFEHYGLLRLSLFYLT
jgi:HPt (histidine-containing phosphotransfer) domain-containing protein